jgi:UTP--glucose-1-phosphate uridylyltransferase
VVETIERKLGVLKMKPNIPVYPPKYLLLIAAGLGSRMKAVSSLPKELIPILGKPAIQYAIEEGVAAGLTNIIVVINHKKDIIRRYLEDPDFRVKLYPNIADDLTNTIKKCSFIFLYQKTPSGEVNAIRLAAHIIKNNTFAIIYPDDIHYPFGTALPILCHNFFKTGDNIIGLSHVDSTIAPTIGNTGRVTLRAVTDDLYDILYFHPKSPGSFQLRNDIELRTCGIMISRPNIFEYIAEIELSPGIEFTDGILRTHMLQKEKFLGYHLAGRIYDVGNPVGYRNCISELSLLENTAIPSLKLGG